MCCVCVVNVFAFEKHWLLYSVVVDNNGVAKRSTWQLLRQFEVFFMAHWTVVVDCRVSSTHRCFECNHALYYNLVKHSMFTLELLLVVVNECLLELLVSPFKTTVQVLQVAVCVFVVGVGVVKQCICYDVTDVGVFDFFVDSTYEHNRLLHRLVIEHVQ